MAPPKQLLQIPLGPGLQTDVDEKLLPVGKVIQVENGVWNRAGELVKRPGGALIGSNYVSTSPAAMPTPWQLATHKGALVTLSQAGPRPIGVYSPQLTKWMTPAGLSNNDAINGVASRLRGQVMPRRNTIYRSNAAGGATDVVFAPDMATNGTYALVAWIENNNTAFTAQLRAQIVEISTGKMLFSYSVATTFGLSQCRCVFVNSQLQLVWIDGVNVKLVVWTIANLNAGTGAASAPFALAADAFSFPIDAMASGTDLLVIYGSGAGATTHVLKRTSGGVVTVVNLTTAAAGAIPAGKVCWMSDLSASGKLAAITATATTINVQWDINGAGLPAATYVLNAATTNILSFCGHTITNVSTGEFVVTWCRGVTGSQELRIGRRTVAAGITDQVWIYSATVGSKAWLHNGEFYALVAYESQTQGTAFAIRVPTNMGDATDTTRTPSARFCTQEAADMDRVTPPSAIQLSTDVFIAPVAIRTRFVLLPTGLAFDTGIDTVTLTFNPTAGVPREFADSLYVCGGVLGAFDGTTFAEEGFHLAPETPTVTNRAGGAMTLLGTYYYQFVYRYSDEFGRDRRSAPSLVATITLTGANQSTTVVAKTLKLHGRPGKVVGELYRNAAAGVSTVLQLVAVVANDETVDTVTIIDTNSDAAIGASEVLYTTGDVLEYQPPPPALAIATYKDRLAVVSAEDPTLIWISLPLVDTDGPRFNDQSTVRIDDDFGDLVTLAGIDDKLVAFKGDACYAILGDGPDVTGNGSFGLPLRLATGLGCAEPRSVVRVPDGVMFRSSSQRSGIWLVNRGLSLEYIGGPVEAYKGLSIVDAVHVPALTRTEFFTSSGRTLVYDGAIKLWTTYTGQNASAATVWNGHHVYQLASSGNLSMMAEDTTGASYSDNGASYDLFALTPWLSLAGLKGYHRFHILQGIGQSVGRHLLTVTLYANFNGTATTIATKTRTMLAADDWNAWELKHPCKRSSFQVGIRASDDVSGASAGPKISALTFLWAPKEGLRKVADGYRLT
jgi:hypothetical protein